MAVTQQLARISAAQLEACRQSVDELDRLCALAMAPWSDHLDLDWAPEPLLRIYELACADLDAFDALVALRRAFGGDAEVNDAYRDHPDVVWGRSVTFLSPGAVAVIALALQEAEPVMMAALSLYGGEASAVAGEILPGAEDPQAYLAGHFAALLGFYAEAARRSLAVVLWWD